MLKCVTSLALLLLAPLAAAEPCGDVALEGQCNGKTRLYCNADELRIEECAECCGWDGNNFDCLEQCPAEGECIEECLEGTDVFGCSLHNTHEWTCASGADGCTDRNYVKCGPDQICDEAGTHKCRNKSEVNLCGGIPEVGKCDAGVFKKCVAGAIETDDCKAKGQSCVETVGCSADCPFECLDGESGCGGAAEAWSCVADPSTGCFVQASKKCGAKACYEGKCRFQAEIDELEAQKAAEAQDDLGSVAEPEAAVSSDTGCQAGYGHPMLEGTLIVLATLMGFILFSRIARRRDPRRRGKKSCGQTGEHPPVV